MLNKLSNFSYAAILYLIMGYHNILITDASKKLCTITTSFGKYKYNCIPMGVCIAPDIFQERMSALVDDSDFFRVYLDDLIIITSGSFEEHLAKVKEVMTKHVPGLGEKIVAVLVLNLCVLRIPFFNVWY